jgi:O-antigen/teichoic acid export membrane protein
VIIQFIANFFTLIFNICCYRFWGITGLGIASLSTNIIVLLTTYFIVKIKYTFSFDKNFIILFLVQLLYSIVCFCAVKFIDSPYQYILGSILILLSALYSFKELDKRINFKSVIVKYKK